MNKARRLLLQFILILLISMATIFGAVVSYAYFSTLGYVITNNGDKQVAQIGMNISLLFDRLAGVENGTSLGIVASVSKDGDGNVTDTTYYKYDSSADWGTAQNPYIISDIRHLQNLSVLQDIGYFDALYIQNNFDENGDYDEENGNNIPYFLVCDNEGNPTVINGEGIEFEPIGTDRYPFIGYVGGAFKSGETSVNEMTSDTSTLYNIHTVTTTDVTDIGLFGLVGYLGNEVLPDAEHPATSFKGQISTVRDLLLYDVNVSVRNPKWTEVLASHLFSYSNAGEFAEDLPHENHHIGILAGHVEYAAVENISVYYSDANICAINLLHTQTSDSGVVPNYASSTGILGMLYNMNPTVDENGNIGVGTGTNESDLSLNGGGVGSGGGLVSGTGRGYVTAENVYETYQYNGGIYSFEDDGFERSAFMVYYTAETKQVRTARNTYVDTHYTLEDGTPLIFTTENGKPVMQYWFTSQNFFGQTQYEHTSYDKFITRESDGKYYYLGDRNREVESPQQTSIYIRLAVDENGKNLCTQYVRDRLIAGTQATEMYYFYDGVFTFALSNAEDKIESTWQGVNADQFTIGPNSDASWKANYDKGASAAIAITSTITNMTELNSAIGEGKQIIIVYEQGDSDKVLNLSTQATKVGNNGATLAAGSVGKLPDDLYETFKDAYHNGLITTAPEGHLTLDDLKNNWDDYTYYYFGTTSADNTFSDLKNTFNVTVTPDMSSGKIIYTAENGSSLATGDLTATDATYNTYEEASYDGYFVYEQYTYFIRSYYRYRYYSSTNKNGTTVYDERNNAKLTPAVVDTYKGENIYSISTTGNTPRTYTGVIIDADSGKLRGTSHDAAYDTSSSGDGKAYWEYGTPHTATYILQDNTSGTTKYYAMAANGASITQVYNVQATGATTNEASGSLPLYSCTQTENGNTVYYTGILISKDYSYTSTFGHGSNYMQILRLYNNYILFFGTGNAYAIWNGANASSTYGNYYQSADRNANLVFNNDKTVSISYTINGATRYLSYGTDNFAYTNSKRDTCRFKLYAIEAMDQAAYGRITYDPIDSLTEGTDYYTFSADEYLLWPDKTMTGSDLVNKATDGTYSVVRLGDGYDLDPDLGWKNSYGEPLTKDDLYKKFTMGKGIGGTNRVISLGNGNLSFGDDGTLTAPIGSTGEKADIPTGCVAFRVNTAAPAQTPHKIRVIVAVPVSDYYYNEQNVTHTMDYDIDYYFALWQVEAAGTSILSTFNLAAAKEAFELPRSSPYDPTQGNSGELTTGVSKYITVKYDADGNGEKETYRCYLNGDRVLVAYEFKVTDVGVYILGSNHPMQIVYFSADATSSAGRDGSSGCKLGSIDFVYDNSAVKAENETTKVVTVTTLPADPDNVTQEDYNYYYASLSILYTDNTGGGTEPPYPDINDLQIYIKRKAELKSDESGTTGVTTIYAQVSSENDDSNDADYLIIKKYSVAGDDIKRNESGESSP